MGKEQWESQELHLALLDYAPSAVLASQGLLCLGIISGDHIAGASKMVSV